MSRRRSRYRNPGDTPPKRPAGVSGKPGTGPTAVDATSEGAEALRRLEELRSRIVVQREPEEDVPANNPEVADGEHSPQPDPPQDLPVTPQAGLPVPIPGSQGRPRTLTMPTDWMVSPPSVEDFAGKISKIRDSATLRTLLHRPPQMSFGAIPRGWQGVPMPLTRIFTSGISPLSSIPMGGMLTEEGLRQWWTLVLWRAAAIHNYWTAWCELGDRPRDPFNGYVIVPTSQPGIAIPAYRMGYMCWILGKSECVGLRYSALSLIECTIQWERARKDHPRLVRIK